MLGGEVSIFYVHVMLLEALNCSVIPLKIE
jgi:hypothetical protein